MKKTNKSNKYDGHLTLQETNKTKKIKKFDILNIVQYTELIHRRAI